MIESTKDLSLSEERQRSPTKPTAAAESEESAAEAAVSPGAQENPALVTLNPKKVRILSNSRNERKTRIEEVLTEGPFLQP